MPVTTVHLRQAIVRVRVGAPTGEVSTRLATPAARQPVAATAMALAALLTVTSLMPMGGDVIAPVFFVPFLLALAVLVGLVLRQARCDF